MAKKEYSDLKKFRENRLHNDEQIVTWGAGYIGEMMGSGKNKQFNGVLVVTDKRTVFYSKGFLSEAFEEIQHNKVSSVLSKKVMSHTTITVHTSGNDLTFKSLIPEEAEELLKTIDSLKGSSAPAQQNNDPISMIKNLSDLKSQGIITSEEFEQKKAELLRKIG
ncbi:PH domain-containing protein [Bdellovibrio bacteriovorus]|uniref:PH domain-containing protein n=1 Tax=Bdellovibrio bacteriovorus TaxID=959 RepID=UPI003AA843C0